MWQPHRPRRTRRSVRHINLHTRGSSSSPDDDAEGLDPSDDGLDPHAAPPGDGAAPPAAAAPVPPSEADLFDQLRQDGFDDLIDDGLSGLIDQLRTIGSGRPAPSSGFRKHSLIEGGHVVEPPATGGPAPPSPAAVPAPSAPAPAAPTTASAPSAPAPPVAADAPPAARRAGRPPRPDGGSSLKVIPVIDVGDAAALHAVPLAAALARTLGPVLLVDLDPRGLAAAALDAPADGPALADVLRGEASIEAAVCRDVRPDLDVLSGAPASEVPGDVFALSDRLDAVRAGYDAVVLVGPPASGALVEAALVAADAIVVTAAADAGATARLAERIDQARNVRLRIGSAAPILGVALTSADGAADPRHVEAVRAEQGGKLFTTVVASAGGRDATVQALAAEIVERLVRYGDVFGRLARQRRRPAA